MLLSDLKTHRNLLLVSLVENLLSYGIVSGCDDVEVRYLRRSIELKITCHAGLFYDDLLKLYRMNVSSFSIGVSPDGGEFFLVLGLQ